jgi:hypothetical protein
MLDRVISWMVDNPSLTGLGKGCPLFGIRATCQLASTMLDHERLWELPVQRVDFVSADVSQCEQRIIRS